MVDDGERCRLRGIERGGKTEKGPGGVIKGVLTGVLMYRRDISQRPTGLWNSSVGHPWGNPPAYPESSFE